jgi:hypothetical protein
MVYFFGVQVLDALRHRPQRRHRASRAVGTQAVCDETRHCGRQTSNRRDPPARAMACAAGTADNADTNGATRLTPTAP